MSDWLEQMGVTILKTNQGFQQILEKLVETARPSSVFAPPLTAGEYTVITASEVYAAMGVGYGGGGGKGPEDMTEEAAAEQPSEESTGEQPAENTMAAGSGVGAGGGGGGVSLGRPVAAITIGPEGVSVEPIVDATKIALAFFTTLGAMAMMWSRMNRK